MWILLYDCHSFGDFVHVLWFCGIWLDWSNVAYVTIWMYNKLQLQLLLTLLMMRIIETIFTRTVLQTI